MAEDAKQLVQRWEKCQKFAPAIKSPPNNLKHIHNPIPFAQWGLDLLGPFTMARNKKRYLIVAVDYFTKWVEAEAISTINESQVEKFIWQNIITRFGLPKVLTFDRGSQFDCDPLRSYLAPFQIKMAYASVCHPKCNGQAEAANKQILYGLQKKLDDKKAAWVDELHDTLWSLRTTPKESTGQSPYRLTFGSEALIPVEIGVQTSRVQRYDPADNDEVLLLEKDLLEEERNAAAARLQAYQNRIARYYNRKVRHRSFEIGDLVLRNAKAVQKDKIHGKLSEKWEGPYIIFEDYGNGTYGLKERDGTAMKSKWNVSTLKRFFA